MAVWRAWVRASGQLRWRQVAERRSRRARPLIEAFQNDVRYYTWIDDFMHTRLDFDPIHERPDSPGLSVYELRGDS